MVGGDNFVNDKVTERLKWVEMANDDKGWTKKIPKYVSTPL